MIAWVRRVSLAVLYLVLMAALALGGAGVVALWSHPPGGPSRAELTWDGDRTLTPALDEAQGKLTAIAADVDQLALQARGALASLTAVDRSAFVDALATGGLTAVSVEGASAALRVSLTALPGASAAETLRYGSDVLARRSAMIAALDATEGLGRSWATLTAGSTQAARLVGLLGDHDTTVAAAAAKGRAADYTAALTILGTALATLDDATTIRDRLANAADVSTLDDWIGRNRRYDQALVALYSALRDAGGKVTDAVRSAYAEEGVARGQLPPDTRALVVIIEDIGRGGLNQAVIAIEQARGRLTVALQALTSRGVLTPPGRTMA